MGPLLVPTLGELAAEFDRAHAALRCATPDDEDNFDAALARMHSICQEVAEIQPQTVEHLRLKARASLWYEHPDQREPVPTGKRLAFQIANALISTHHPRLPYRSSL